MSLLLLFKEAGGVVETIVAQDFPRLYFSAPIAAKSLISKVSGETKTVIANNFPRLLLKAGKARDLMSRWS